MSTLNVRDINHPNGVPSLVIESNGDLTIVNDTLSVNDLTTTNINATNISATDITATTISSGQLSGLRNKVMNGDMRVAQRGTSYVSPILGAYTLDRWQWAHVGTMAVTVTQDSDVPTSDFRYSYKVDVTTADASIAAGDYTRVINKVEGYNIHDLVGNTFTLSFWVKSAKTGVHCIYLSNSGADRSYIMEYTVNAINTWEKKILTVSGGLTTAGTWNYINGLGLSIGFSLAAGSTFQTTAGSWQTGTFFATSNQVNVMDNTANNFWLTGVQLEKGNAATDFERTVFGDEYARCQRYYQTNNNSHGSMNEANTQFVCPCGFWVPMRTDPTAAIANATNGIHRPGIAFYNISSINSIAPQGYIVLIPATLFGAEKPGQLVLGAIAYTAEL